MGERISIDEYYITIAIAASQRSTCDRAKVGSIIVDQTGLQLSSGYNGSLPGYEHCDKLSCYYSGRCIRTTHAEINAINRAIKNGFADRIEGSTLYSSHRPCYACTKTLAAFGIKTIVYNKLYEDPKAEAYFKLVKMNVYQVTL